LPVDEVVERSDSSPASLGMLAAVRKPGAKIERPGPPRLNTAPAGESLPICARCATSRPDPIAVLHEVVASPDRLGAGPVAPAGVAATAARSWHRLHDLVAIARPDHWFKNVFVLPGAFVAWTMDPTVSVEGLPLRLLVGLGAVCLVASSNYVVNEALDAPSDRHHRTKRQRPLAAGRVGPASAYVLWLLLMVGGLGLGFASVALQFGLTLVALWLMGCVYNIPPIRTKDIPYVDVLSEAVNNPIRMLAGWYIVSVALPPASLLLSYWMVGCYFMAIKRLAECREIGDARQAVRYRRSFGHYTAERLLISIVFYASAAMLFFGAFLMRYRFELIVSFPFIALVMAIYLRLGFKPDSPAQHPEKLYREPLFMASAIVCTLLMLALLAVDLPGLHAIFVPTVPPSPFWGPELGR
jgi:4-hydroxybenzoate polyprenyltransferase